MSTDVYSHSIYSTPKCSTGILGVYIDFPSHENLNLFIIIKMMILMKIRDEVDFVQKETILIRLTKREAGAKPVA